MSLDTIVSITLIFGIVLGASILIVAILISIIKREMSAGGAGYCLIGVILLGMSIWTSIKVELPGGIVVELETKLKEYEQVIASIEVEREAMLSDVKKMEAAINQIDTTRRIMPKQIQTIKNNLADVETRNAVIDRQLINLNSINKEAREDLERLKKTAKIKPKKIE